MSGLYVLVALRYFKLQESVRNVLLGVLLVGVAWEILEIWYKVAEIHMGYWLNTAKDIASDLIGGYLSLKLWKRLPEMK